MSVLNGTEGNDVFYMNTMEMKVGEDAHGYSALGGDDTVYGSKYVDFIYGGTGNDILYGNGGDDALFGETGNDQLSGGVGVDLLHGGDGNDVLDGGAGFDDLLGGFGNDLYVAYIGQGQDRINDGVTSSFTPGYGGGIDTVQIPNLTLNQVYAGRYNNDLYLSSVADASDGQLNEGVVITNFFLGGIYTIEYLQTSDYTFNLSQYFGVV